MIYGWRDEEGVGRGEVAQEARPGLSFGDKDSDI